MKITMNVSDELLKRVDAFAKENYTTRTAIFTFAANQYLLQNDTRKYFEQVLALMKEVALRGTLNDEQQKILQQIQSVCDLMSVS